MAMGEGEGRGGSPPVGRATDHSHVVTVRLADATWAHLQALCQSTGESVSEVVARALDALEIMEIEASAARSEQPSPAEDLVGRVLDSCRRLRGAGRVRLALLRRELADIDRDVLDAAWRHLQRLGHVAFSPLPPEERTREDEQAALRIGGEAHHLVELKGVPLPASAPVSEGPTTTGPTLNPRSYREEVSRRVQELLATGLGSPRLAAILAREGWPTLTGRGRWSSKTVARLGREAEAEIGGRIRGAHLRATEGRCDLPMRLAALRAALPEIARADLDAALLRLQAQGTAVLCSIEASEAVTAEDRVAAVEVGVVPRHLLYLR
jgi:hypothetical protein